MSPLHFRHATLPPRLVALTAAARGMVSRTMERAARGAAHGDLGAHQGRPRLSTVATISATTSKHHCMRCNLPDTTGSTTHADHAGH
jgi:hypothetical protein